MANFNDLFNDDTFNELALIPASTFTLDNIKTGETSLAVYSENSSLIFLVERGQEQTRLRVFEDEDDFTSSQSKMAQVINDDDVEISSYLIDNDLFDQLVSVSPESVEEVVEIADNLSTQNLNINDLVETIVQIVKARPSPEYVIEKLKSMNDSELMELCKSQNPLFSFLAYDNAEM